MKINKKIKSIMFNDLNLDNRINILFAPNGTGKSLLYSDLKERSDTICYSYLSLIKDNKFDNVNIFKPNVIVRMLKKIENKNNMNLINKLKDKLGKLNENIKDFEYDVIIVGDKEVFLSNIELFINDFEEIKNLWKKDDFKNLNYYEFLKFCQNTYGIFKSIDLNDNFYTSLISKLKNELNYTNRNIENYEKKIDELELEIKKSNFDDELESQKEINEDNRNNIVKYKDRIQKAIDNFFSSSIDIINQYIPNSSHLLNELISCNNIYTFFYNIIIYRKKIFRISNFFVNNTNLEEVFEHFKDINILEIDKIINSIFKKFKKENYDKEIDYIINNFNKDFFDYIKIKKIKLLDFILNKNNFFLKVFNRDILINNKNSLSDGELNSLYIINFFMECLCSDENKKYMVIDDISLTYDLKNKIGIMKFIFYIFNKTKLNIILPSHDISFVYELFYFLLRYKINSNNISLTQLIRNEKDLYQKPLDQLILNIDKIARTDRNITLILILLRSKYKFLNDEIYKDISNIFFHYNNTKMNLNEEINKIMPSKYKNNNWIFSKYYNMYEFLKDILNVDDNYCIKSTEKTTFSINDKITMSLFIRMSAEYEYFCKTNEKLYFYEIIKKLNNSKGNKSLFELYKNLNFYLSDYLHLNESNLYKIISIDDLFFKEKFILLRKIKEYILKTENGDKLNEKK